MLGKPTEEGAKDLLDPRGNLKAREFPFVLTERNDAGTGMVATNSVGKKSSNVVCQVLVFLPWLYWKKN